MITKEYKISLFRARCREYSNNPDNKIEKNHSYIVVTEDFKWFSIYKDDMITLVMCCDIRALLAYFSFYNEDAEVIESYISHDNFIVEHELGMTYFEEY